MIIMIVLMIVFVGLLIGFLIQTRYEKYYDLYEKKWEDRYHWQMNEEEKAEKERIKEIADNYNCDVQFRFMIAGILDLIIIFGLTFVICVRNTQYNRNRIRAQYEVEVAEVQANCIAIGEVKDVIAKANAIKEHNTKVSQYRLEIMQSKINLKNPFINWFVSDEWNKLDENEFKYIGE